MNIHRVNPLYLIIGEVDRSIEEKSGTFKKVLKKYMELWKGIKNLIEKINGSECDSIESGKYGKNLMKIQFNSDDNLPLNKLLKPHVLKIIVRSVFHENNKYYPQIFLDECLYESI